MPTNIRLRAQRVGLPQTTIVLRPLLAIPGITRTASGAVLAQSGVRAFRTLGDVVISREVSDPLGRYAAPVTVAGAAHYVVAIQDATWDSQILTWDNATVTLDREKSIGGVTANNLVGSS